MGLRSGRVADIKLVAAVWLTALTLKAGLLMAGAMPFNADEALVALMARHILHGARPLFVYGQAYMGSLDAWLTAWAFALLGESVLTMRLVQIGLWLGVIGLAYGLGREVFGSRWTAALGALFLAVPPVLVTLYSTVTLGGYNEALLFGLAALWLALRLGAGRGGPFSWLTFGLLSGLGFWSFPLVSVYLLPAGAYLLWTQRRGPGRWLLAGLGGLLGAVPWLLALIFTPSHIVSELGGAALPSTPILQRLYNLLLFGWTVLAGLRPPWNAQFLALPLAPYALAIHTGVLVYAAQRLARPAPGANRAGLWLLTGSGLTLAAAFVLTPFGANPSGRYFLPAAPVMALWLADLFNWLRLRRRQPRAPGQKWFGRFLVFGLLAFYAWGNVQSAVRFPPGLTTQFEAVTQIDQRDLPAVMDFLRAHGETRGYTNYWVEYPLAFLSQETLIFTARLPYHLDFRYTPRDDRYAPYSQLVDQAARAAYITTRFPDLDERLRVGLAAVRVQYQETQIGDFHIFYALSRKVGPAELGFK